MTDANTRRRLASLAWIVHDLIELIGSNRAPDTKKDLEELIGRLVDDETGQVTEQVTGQVKTPGEQKVEVLKFETLAELEKRCALQLETIRHLREEIEKAGDEVRNRMDREDSWDREDSCLETIEHLKQVTSEHARRVNELTAEVICDLRAELDTQRQSWAEHGAHMAKDAIMKLVMSLGWRTSLVQKINGLTVATLLKGGSK